MNKNHIEKVAQKIAKDYSKGKFSLHEMNAMYQDLILWFAEWHLKNAPKKKIIKPISQ